MKRFIFLLNIIIFIFTATIILAKDNIFNNYLLHRENFKITYPSLIDKNFIQNESQLKLKQFQRNPFSNDKLKKFFDIKSKIILPEINLKLNNKTNFSFKLKEEQSEFIPVANKKENIFKKGYSFNFKQFWGYNVASQFSYIYQKEYFSQIKDFNLSEKKYSFNLTKFFNKGDKFNFLYQYTTTNNSNDNENLFMLKDEKNHEISLSYELSFSKRFSLVLLYSLKDSETEDENLSENLFYTGFKFSFDTKSSK